MAWPDQAVLGTQLFPNSRDDRRVYVPRLSRPLEADLRAATFTYMEVGQTAGALPIGYRALQRSRWLPSESFEAAVTDLFSWRIHQRAGLCPVPGLVEARN